MGNYTIFLDVRNPKRGRQARNFTTTVPKILDLKSSSEQIFFKNWRWVPLLFGLIWCSIWLVPSRQGARRHGKGVTRNRGAVHWEPHSLRKAAVKQAKKSATRFAILLQNELQTDVARFTTHVQTCLGKKINVVVSCVYTDFWSDEITRESRHTRELRHLLQSKFALGR